MKYTLIFTLIASLVFATVPDVNHDDCQLENVAVKLTDIQEGMLTRKLEDGRYEVLPHINTKVNIKIDGMVSSTVVEQIFTNNTNEPIEAVYIFPLPIDAAIYDMKMLINDRLIQGEIKERQEAKRIYTEAKNSGKRAALTEQERPNIFTNSVANVMPGDTIIVQLQYVEKLCYEDGAFSLRFPMVVAPRYIAGKIVTGYSGSGWALDTDVVPNASRITPIVIPSGYRSGNNISISVELNAGLPILDIFSLSHKINVENVSDSAGKINLLDGKVIPNKDFVLEYRIKSRAEPQAALFTAHKGNDYYFMLMAVPPTISKDTDRLPKEMIMVIDVSGSMAGTSIVQAKRGIKHALNTLISNDYFNIIQFESNYELFQSAPIRATKENIAKALNYVDKFDADGGTEAKSALLAAMQQVSHSEAVSTILFLTDGDVGNEDEIIREVKENLNNTRLFCVGIGSAPNSHLLNKISKFGRGTFTYISDLIEVETKLSALFRKIDSPALTDIRLDIAGKVDTYPNPIPDLFEGQPMIVFGKINDFKSSFATFNGRSPDGIINQKLSLNLSKAAKNPAIATLWAREKIEGLMDDYRLGNADVRQNIINLAIEHHLLTKFTSFVAVENKIVNSSGKVNLQHIPVDLPDGWEYDKVFGSSTTKSRNAKISMAATEESLPQTGTAYPLVLLIGLTLVLISMLWYKKFVLKHN